MKNKTFLCIANRRWDALWGESQKIMLRISKNNTVLFFEPGRGVNLPLLSEIKRNFPNLFKLQLNRISENLINIPCPPSLPIARRHLPRFLLKITTPLVTKINTALKINHVRKAIKTLNINEPILWLYSPYYYDLVGKFNEKLSVYHNYDEFADFNTNARVKELILHYDNELTRRVDLVFATSRPQWKRRRAINPNSFFVPNGVDFELFNRPLSEKLPIPDDIKTIPHPIIGFAGMLGNHIDVKLLLEIAEQYPKYSLVLLGPDLLPGSEQLNQLRKKTNVHFLGFKPMEKLPDYVQTFDVALIPYELTGHVLSGYPQKLHEYLAVGRSIVATAMPELEPYKKWVNIARNNKEFVQLIEIAKDNYSDIVINERVEVARKNTWDNRVVQMYQHMEEFVKAVETK
ncbi:MAG: glycosyltransferase [bacterium]|nr:glycosyltransferase [bacterium]